MIMIVHQAVGMTQKVILPIYTINNIEKYLPIRIIYIYEVPVISPGSDVIYCSCIFYPYRSCQFLPCPLDLDKYNILNSYIINIKMNNNFELIYLNPKIKDVTPFLFDSITIRMVKFI